jgi:hypothetical protein
MLLSINDSLIYTELDCYFIDLYVKYIIDILKYVINKNNLKINIILGFCKDTYNFNNNNKIIKIDLNWEHTLVKKGGRDSANFMESEVMSNSNEKYLIRIERYEQIELADIIIDYSIPNMYNINTKKFYERFFSKMIYISPMLLKYDINRYTKNNRNLNILTTFLNVNMSDPRRNKLMDKLNNSFSNYKNINNCFKMEELKDLYGNTKVLINIHQTEHHQTFEEMRILPALLSGVIVISEISPLNNLIPYNDYIIWSSYDNIVETAKKIITNYDYYFNKIYRSTNSLSILHNNNILKLQDKLLNNL